MAGEDCYQSMQAFPGAFPNAEVVGNPVRTMCWRCRCRSNVWQDVKVRFGVGSGGFPGRTHS